MNATPHPSSRAALLAALVLAVAAGAQDLSAIDVSGAWKTKGQAIFEPNDFGVKALGLVLPLHLVQQGTLLDGVAVDKAGKCGTYLPPVDGSLAGGVFSLHLLAPGHDLKTCDEVGHVELTLHGTPLDNVHATYTGTGEVDIGWYVFPFTITGKARRVSGLQTPDDPDGAGPAVPLDLMGSGEPGTEGAHDLALTRIRAPKWVPAKGTPAVGAGVVKVHIQNRGQHAEVIDDAGVLEQVVTLELLPVGGSDFAWSAALRPPAPGKFPLVLAPRAKLVVTFDVTFTEAWPAPADGPCKTQDFEVTARAHHEALAGALPDDHPADDSGPRGVLPPYAFDTYPDGRIRDRGVGAKLPDGTFGAPVIVRTGFCLGGL
jgi:hypothetical protein